MTTRESLDAAGLRIERMWRQGAPKQVAEMEASGTFYGFILSLQQQEQETYERLLGQGLAHDQAMEMVTSIVAPPLEHQPE